MIFFLFQLSVCKQVYNFTYGTVKNLLLNIEPFDIIEIALKSGYGAFFSSWEDYSNLTIEVYDELTINDNPIQAFGSNNGLIGVAFKDKRAILRILNEGEKTYQLYILICSYIPNPQFGAQYTIPKGFSMPIIEYAKTARLSKIDQLSIPFIYGYDSANSHCKPVIISLMVVLGLFVLCYVLSFLVLKKSEKQKKL